MLPHIPSSSGTRASKKLRKLFESLSEADQATLMSFAEFLAQKSVKEEISLVLEAPKDIPRPEEESVVKAIKRLTVTYPMINPEGLLDQTSSLMTAHVLQGRAATEVIDELEALFAERYQAMKLTTSKNE